MQNLLVTTVIKHHADEEKALKCENINKQESFYTNSILFKFPDRKEHLQWSLLSVSSFKFQVHVHFK